MRVAMYYNNADVRLEEMPTPKVGPGELLIRIEASGICGSDVMEWYRIKKAPLVLGHEIAGEIVEVGNGVERYKVGDRVAASHHVPCNTCHYCLSDRHTMCPTLRSTTFDPGGFAEYVRLPAINVDRGVYPLPDEVSYEEATFVEPLACVLRAQRIAGLRPGQSVVVVGSGMTGLLHINLARALGAGRIIATDITRYRLGAARRFGADNAIDASEDVPARVRELNGGRLADKVFVCAGAVSAINQGLQSVDRGGTVLLFAPTDPGITIPVSVTDLFFSGGVTVTSSYAGSPADHMTAVELLRAGSVNVGEMISHRLGLEETGSGFKLVAEAKESMKVIIEPQR
ncbi:MAG: alcohol dehydrogenase catalytic domain-containing protein [Candidatus Abyssubacteria bacterium]|nr:alcohol dehydrogenase catalytic domain-containing protein [Candidatus Abyssubacteria bacterium]